MHGSQAQVLSSSVLRTGFGAADHECQLLAQSNHPKLKDHGPVAASSFCPIEGLVSSMNNLLDALIQRIDAQLGDPDAERDGK